MRYFAYGSNLWVPRLIHRVPAAHLVGPALLDGWRLSFDKRGSDGSGKCTVGPASKATNGRADAPLLPPRVHGALYHVPDHQRHLLDRVEALGVGYDRAQVAVRFALTGEVEEAWTYLGRPDQVDPALRPFTWYRDFVVRGAAALGAPPAYLAALEAVAARIDPDGDRERRERSLLEVGPHPDRATPGSLV